MFLANIMAYALAADISIIKLLISCSKYGLYLTAVKIVCSLIFRLLLAINTQCAVIDMQIILNDMQGRQEDTFDDKLAQDRKHWENK